MKTKRRRPPSSASQLVREVVRAIAAIEASGKKASYSAICKEVTCAPIGVRGALHAHPELFRRTCHFDANGLCYREHWAMV